MEIIVLLGALVASIVVGVLSTGLPQLAADPGGPALFPLVAASITGVACALLIGQRLLARAGTTQSHGRSDTARRLFDNARTNIRQLIIVVLVLVFPFGIEWLGFNIAVLLFTFLVLLVSGKSFVVTALTSVFITAGVYVGYVVVLGAVLPHGRLFY